MKTLKSLIRSLIFSGCGNKEEDNQKDKDFTNFLIRDGRIDSCGWTSINFLKDDRNYSCSLRYGLLEKDENYIVISVYDKKSKKHFLCFNNLDYKDNKEKYEMLRDGIPKWYEEYAESKNL